MMFAWSFAARTLEEVDRLLRALGKHRYIKEIDHRIHWTVDAVLADVARFAPHAARFEERRGKDVDLEIASRDPSLWRPASIDDVVAALGAFWTPGDDADRRKDALEELIAEMGLPPAMHAPFEVPPEEPPHPELLLLDWVLFSVDELDAERHAGAFAALEDGGDEVNPSAPVYQEAAAIAVPELCSGCVNGVLAQDFTVWSEEPYSYADYVFRGVTKSAKLVEPPVGFRDF